MALGLNQIEHAYAPTAIRNVKFYKEENWKTGLRCHAQITAHTQESLEADLTVYNAQNEVLMELNGIVCQSVKLQTLPTHIIHKIGLEKIANFNRDEVLTQCTVAADLRTPQSQQLLALLGSKYPVSSIDQPLQII
jgi:GMP synthase PP-ATPase subunit